MISLEKLLKVEYTGNVAIAKTNELDKQNILYESLFCIAI